MELDEKALEAACQAGNGKQKAIGYGTTPSFAYEAAITAYLSALPSSPVSDLVERLQSWDHCWPAPGLENAVADAASTLTTLSAHNAELEAQLAETKAENERLKRARTFWQSQHDERTRQLGMSDTEATAIRALKEKRT